MLTIGELSKATGTNVSTIRYYEQMGLLSHATRSRGNQRRYTESEQECLSFIRQARDLGLPIDAIRDIINLGNGPRLPRADADRITSEQLSLVRNKINRLKKLEKEIVRVASEVEGDRFRMTVVDGFNRNRDG